MRRAVLASPPKYRGTLSRRSRVLEAHIRTFCDSDRRVIDRGVWIEIER